MIRWTIYCVTHGKRACVGIYADAAAAQLCQAYLNLPFVQAVIRVRVNY